MSLLQRVRPWLLATVAISFLLVMIWTGRAPEHAHFNAFEAGGLLREPPESVTQVTLQRAAQQWVGRRVSAQWVDAHGQPLAAPLAASLEGAVRFMHTAAPVRLLAPAASQTRDLAQFGLSSTALTITLANSNGILLQFALGGQNPDGLLRYGRTAEVPGVVLMSGFVGQAWDEVAAELLVPSAAGRL
jgi:hypothetical protein